MLNLSIDVTPHLHFLKNRLSLLRFERLEQPKTAQKLTMIDVAAYIYLDLSCQVVLQMRIVT